MMLDEAQRSAALDQELLRIASNGGQIVARTPTTAVVIHAEAIGRANANKESRSTRIARGPTR